MLKGHISYPARDRLLLAARLLLASVWPALMAPLAPGTASLAAGGTASLAAGGTDPEWLPGSGLRLKSSIVVTQVPAGAGWEAKAQISGGTLRAGFGDGARLVVVRPERSAVGTPAARILSRGFYGACDPEVSFDGKRILFAGKRAAADNWNIYEASVDGSSVRQITRDLGDCRSPGYQSTLYTIVSPKPWHQLTFVGNAAGTMNEYGEGVATALYSCRLDGSAVRRLTFNLSSDMDPFLMSDGRLLFAGWQRSHLDHGIRGRVGLFGINIDGTDYALFAGHPIGGARSRPTEWAGRRVKQMPCVTTGGLVVFVEADEVPWDGAGYLSCVRIRRPLHSYRQITDEQDGLFHGPSPLGDGTVLVSRRPRNGKGTHGVCRLDPVSGKVELLLDDPRYHDLQARVIHPRSEPDGRSSVVTEEDPNGELYCLNVYLSDLEDRTWMPSGTVKRLRVLEGVPLKKSDSSAYLPALQTLPGAHWPGSTVNGLPPLAQRRILGEIDVEGDGSFHVELPANTPVELQILDADGMALRSCGWIWAKNHEPRGCIGCHEGGELTPENVLMDAVVRPAVSLSLPPRRRRTVDFRRDVMPIIQRKCVGCHGPGQPAPRLDGGLALIGHGGGRAYFNRAYESLLVHEDSQRGEGYRGEYVHPGKARTSRLIWHVFGRNTSRPWDGAVAREAVKVIPAGEHKPLSDDEQQTFVEWIDMGAAWDGIPGEDNLPGKRS